MRSQIIFYLITVLLISIPQKVEAYSDKILFATESWAAATEKDGTGLYWDIMRAIYEPENIKVTWTIKAYATAVKLVKRKKADAVIGVYKNEVKGVVYPRNHFAIDMVNAVSDKRKKIDWRGEQSLAGMRIGWIKGYSYDNYIGVSIMKKEIYDRKTALRVLHRGRIDFYLDAAADLKDYIKTHPAAKEKFDLWVLKTLKLYVVFKDDKKGRDLASIFDRRFEVLLKDGTINSLYRFYINEMQANFSNPFPSTETHPPINLKNNGLSH